MHEYSLIVIVPFLKNKILLDKQKILFCKRPWLAHKVDQRR